MNRGADATVAVASDLIYLLSCAVNEEIPDAQRCAAMSLPDVYALAQRHSLTVAAACALEQVMALPSYFKEEKFKAIRRLSYFDIERTKLLRAFEENQIWYLPLKGIIMKELYPKAAMREMSDNDILCDKDDLQKIHEIMTGMGFVCTSFCKAHHDEYKAPTGIKFEIHGSLFHHTSTSPFDWYFENIKNRLIKDDDNQYGYHMTQEDFYIYQICHLYKHYYYSGTGLRSLLDVYVFNKKFRQAEDSAYLQKAFQEIDLVDFESRIRQLAHLVFSGQTLSADERTELLSFIQSNTYGTLDVEVPRHLKNDDSFSAKKKYVLSRLFPPEEIIREFHPVVYRHKVLYPLWIAYRPINAALHKRKKISKELKLLINYKSKDQKNE